MESPFSNCPIFTLETVLSFEISSIEVFIFESNILSYTIVSYSFPSAISFSYETLFGIISPPSFTIARPAVPFPYSFQFSGVPGLFIRLSATSPITFSILFVFWVFMTFCPSFSIDVKTMPKINKTITRIIPISIALISNQPVLFSVGFIQNQTVPIVRINFLSVVVVRKNNMVRT